MEEGDAIYWCKKCNEKTDHPHKREKLKGGEGNPFAAKAQAGNKDDAQEKSKFLDNLFEEYHNLDYEDVIGGGTVKTRFKYTNVAKADYGLTEEEIFLLDDR